MATTNATAPKSAPKKSQGFTGIKSGFAVIIVCFLIAECLYVFGAGHLSNFHAEGATGLPFHFFQDQSYEPAGIVGTVYKGGFIVPIIGRSSSLLLPWLSNVLSLLVLLMVKVPR